MSDTQKLFAVLGMDRYGRSLSLATIRGDGIEAVPPSAAAGERAWSLAEFTASRGFEDSVGYDGMTVAA